MKSLGIDSDFEFDVNIGRYPRNAGGVVQSAYQTANTLGTESDVWSGAAAGVNMTWLQAAIKLEVLSADATDSAAGAGARTIFLIGLDANFNQITESVTLNGVTPVATVQSFLRLNRAWVATAGTWGGANAGLITIRGISAGATQGLIPIQAGRLAKSQFTVPAGKKFLMQSVIMASEATKPCTFKVYIREAAALAAPFGSKQLGLIYNGIEGAYKNDLHNLPALAEKIDIWMTATPAANNTIVSVEIQGIMYTA